jgi:hypothetical protein
MPGWAGGHGPWYLAGPELCLSGSRMRTTFGGRSPRLGHSHFAATPGAATLIPDHLDCDDRLSVALLLT